MKALHCSLVIIMKKNHNDVATEYHTKEEGLKKWYDDLTEHQLQRCP